MTVWGLLRPRLVNTLKTLFSRGKLHTENPPLPDLTAKRRSIFIRHLDCGSCNGCELELNALNNPVYDIERFGIQFEASPRHADVLVMTGPFTRNLEEAARLTFEAMSQPRRIVTIGDCAKDGGIFKESYAVKARPPELEDAIKATDIHVSGCPPTPQKILQVLLALDTK
jgi:Ni,Fe-hydrogenase III small subunit